MDARIFTSRLYKNHDTYPWMQDGQIPWNTLCQKDAPTDIDLLITDSTLDTQTKAQIQESGLCVFEE